MQQTALGSGCHGVGTSTQMNDDNKLQLIFPSFPSHTKQTPDQKTKKK